MAYDEIRNNTVLFGGADNITGGSLTDTWIWDGTDWTHVTPATTPPVLNTASFAWDNTHGYVLSWGGTPSTTRTWKWDGTDGTSFSPIHHPSGYETAGLVDWRVGGKVLEFGGTNRDSGVIDYNETWTWSGTDWVEIFPVDNPSARNDVQLAYDFTRDQVVLFGGNAAGFSLDDTWVYMQPPAGAYHLENVMPLT